MMQLAFDTTIRVRYAEADRMGYMYYGNYAMYFEQARTEMLRALGFSYRDWEDDHILLPVREMQVRYHAPAYYDDLLTVRTILREMPAVRITFHHEIYNEQEILTCTGWLVLVFVNKLTGRPRKAPEDFLRAIRKRASSGD